MQILSWVFFLYFLFWSKRPQLRQNDIIIFFHQRFIYLRLISDPKNSLFDVSLFISHSKKYKKNVNLSQILNRFSKSGLTHLRLRCCCFCGLFHLLSLTGYNVYNWSRECYTRTDRGPVSWHSVSTLNNGRGSLFHLSQN